MVKSPCEGLLIGKWRDLLRLWRLEYWRRYRESRGAIDHIIAKSHGRPPVLENLAYCCLHCNAFKGPNIAGVDQDTQEVVRLFQPRRDIWEEHFAWEGSRLLGRTSVGRVIMAVLAINAAYRLEVRQALIAEGVFRP